MVFIHNGCVTAMVMILFHDGSSAEVEACEDVVHEPGCLVCVDYLGASLATFPDDDILGYSLDPVVIQKIRAETTDLELPSTTRSRVGTKAAGRLSKGLRSTNSGPTDMEGRINEAFAAWATIMLLMALMTAGGLFGARAID